MGSILEDLDRIADAIKSLDPYANPNIRITEPKIGLCVGKCINCGCQVKLRQPWLSKMPIVNDGWYLLHCENEDCHNYYGMELRENQFNVVDFIKWDDKYLIENQESEGTLVSNIISFEKRCR